VKANTIVVIPPSSLEPTQGNKNVTHGFSMTFTTAFHLCYTLVSPISRASQSNQYFKNVYLIVQVLLRLHSKIFLILREQHRKTVYVRKMVNVDGYPDIHFLGVINNISVSSQTCYIHRLLSVRLM